MYNSLNEFEIRPDATTGFHGNKYGYSGEKWCHHIFLNVFDWIHFILAGNDDIHKTLNEFEIRRGPTMDYGVGCP